MESRSIDFAKIASVDIMTLNNKVVNMRQVVKRTKVQVINKLCKHITALKKKKGNDEQKAKNLRKAERFIEEIESIKKLKDDKVSKYALANTVSFSEVSKASLSSGPRALARLADHALMRKIVSDFREQHHDWRDLAAYLLVKQTGRRFKTKKQKQMKLSKSVENIHASEIMTKAYIKERFGQEGLTRAEQRFERKRRRHSSAPKEGAEILSEEEGSAAKIPKADIGTNSKTTETVKGVEEKIDITGEEAVVKKEKKSKVNKAEEASALGVADSTGEDVPAGMTDSTDEDVPALGVADSTDEDVQALARTENSESEKQTVKESVTVEKFNISSAIKHKVKPNRKRQEDDCTGAKIVSDNESLCNSNERLEKTDDKDLGKENVNIKKSHSKYSDADSTEEGNSVHFSNERLDVDSADGNSNKDSKAFKKENTKMEHHSIKRKSECVIKELKMSEEDNPSSSSSDESEDDSNSSDNDTSEDKEANTDRDQDVTEQTKKQRTGKKKQIPDFLMKSSKESISDAFFAGSDDDDNGDNMNESEQFDIEMNYSDDNVSNNEDGFSVRRSKVASIFHNPHSIGDREQGSRKPHFQHKGSRGSFSKRGGTQRFDGPKRGRGNPRHLDVSQRGRESSRGYSQRRGRESSRGYSQRRGRESSRGYSQRRGSNFGRETRGGIFANKAAPSKDDHKRDNKFGQQNKPAELSENRFIADKGIRSRTDSSANRGTSEKLHPSWEASKKRKEQQSGITAFQGSKITFDDDD